MTSFSLNCQCLILFCDSGENRRRVFLSESKTQARLKGEKTSRVYRIILSSISKVKSFRIQIPFYFYPPSLEEMYSFYFSSIDGTIYGLNRNKLINLGNGVGLSCSNRKRKNMIMYDGSRSWLNEMSDWWGREGQRGLG